MLKSKRGMSEMISTVLLIGLTIAVTTLVMMWANSFFKQTTDETNRISEKLFTCAKDIEIAINDACYSDKLSIFIENKKDKTLEGDFLLLKIEGTNNTIIQPTPPGLSILPFEKRTLVLSYFIELGQIKAITLIPRIKTSKGFEFCTDNLEAFTNIREGC